MIGAAVQCFQGRNTWLKLASVGLALLAMAVTYTVDACAVNYEIAAPIPWETWRARRRQENIEHTALTPSAACECPSPVRS